MKRISLLHTFAIIVLATSLSGGWSHAAGSKFLMDTIATLKVSPTRIDAQKLADAIRQRATP